MSEAYRKAKGGRLAFKGGDLATVRSIDKKKKKKNKNKINSNDDVILNGDSAADLTEPSSAAEGSENIYTIDAAKKMKYEELFPVETKKFGYDPLNKAKAGGKSVEEALDDRVTKKADRYCK